MISNRDLVSPFLSKRSFHFSPSSDWIQILPSFKLVLGMPCWCRKSQYILPFNGWYFNEIVFRIRLLGGLVCLGEALKIEDEAVIRNFTTHFFHFDRATLDILSFEHDAQWGRGSGYARCVGSLPQRRNDYAAQSDPMVEIANSTQCSN